MATRKRRLGARRATTRRATAGRVGVAPRTRGPRAGAGIDVGLVNETLELIETYEQEEEKDARGVGGQVLDGYFGGDRVRVRSRDPLKEESYGELRRRMTDETSWTVARLRRVVCAEIVARDLGDGIAGRVGLTFLTQMYAVDDLAVRRRLGQDIATGKLRGRAAREAIAKESVKVRHGGRAAGPPALRALREVERILERAEKAKAFAEAGVRGLDREVKKEIGAVIKEVKGRIKDIERALKRST